MEDLEYGEQANMDDGEDYRILFSLLVLAKAKQWSSYLAFIWTPSNFGKAWRPGRRESCARLQGVDH
jgi:hypothetical protein